MFLDKWYSSPNLFLKLHQKKINVIGTVRKNRKNMPKDIQKRILKKGECVWKRCNNLLALRWTNKRDVYMISTKHESVEMVEQSDKELQKVMKPKCILAYNKGMGAVDHQDQMLSCFPIMRKVIKGYRKLFFYMSDMALFNTYIMHKTMHSRKKETYVDYRINIAETILQNTELDIHQLNLFDSKRNIGLISQKISIQRLRRSIQQGCVKFVINIKYEAKRSGNTRNVK